MTAAPNASWPLPSLLTSLARAGWGDLHGRSNTGARTVLRALEHLLPRLKAEGKITAGQVADVAGYSREWAGKQLTALEAAGLIVYERGTLVDGRPRPGFVRVVKTAIVALITAARGDGRLAQVRDDRTMARRSRLDKLRNLTQLGRTRKTPSRTDVNSVRPLPPQGESDGHKMGRRPGGQNGHTPMTPRNTPPCLHNRRLSDCLDCSQLLAAAHGEPAVKTYRPPQTCSVCFKDEPTHHHLNNAVQSDARHPFTPKTNRRQATA